MKEFKFSLSNLNLISISCIQLAIALVISLIFQLLIPFSWQPLDTFQYGVKQHGDPGTNIIIFTISQWYFSLSIAWLFYRENPYINNFLIYSIVPLGMIVFYEFSVLYLYYDYIHITPLIVDAYLIWKCRQTLLKRFTPFIITLNSIWLFSVYYFNLAYYYEELLIFIRNVIIYVVLWTTLAFLFKSKKILD
ncbi:MAG: hypothetical protein KGD58_13615 [Candidatus Lokiarchaeota archaeon]|nr:hypothetical protein [Candidatus Lokiarchaeota archaeon]